MKTLFIGSGQAGCRVVNEFIEKYGDNHFSKLLFNTAQDNEIKGTIYLKDKLNKFSGSGKNPLNTLEKIIPENNILIKEAVESKIENIDKVVLINSLGGGSGSAINYHIISDILIPYKEEKKDIKILSAVILPFKMEGNPCNSNSVAMLNSYYKLTKHIVLIPIDNNFIFGNQENVTIENINELICEVLASLIDYNSFVGDVKQNGIGSLDENEFNRVLSPHNGFLLYNEMLIKSFIKKCEDGSLEYFRDNFFNNFDMTTSSSILFLFRTGNNESIPIIYLDKISKIFNNQLKIFAECSEYIPGENGGLVAIVANGVALPKSFMDNANNIVNLVVTRKSEIKEKGKSNKESLKIGKKSLFRM